MAERFDRDGRRSPQRGRPAGGLRFVITHGGRHPAARRGGGGAALLFFNDEGTECEGISFSGRARAGRWEAGAVVALDQFSG